MTISEKIRKNNKVVSTIIGLLSGIVIFLVLGIPTDVIENERYYRMMPTGAMEMPLLIGISILFAIYVGTFSFIGFKKIEIKNITPLGFVGATASFFAISCPTCITFLVTIFGSVAMMNYFDPLRPLIGILSLGLISYGIYNNISIIKGTTNSDCKDCIIPESKKEKDLTDN